MAPREPTRAQLSSKLSYQQNVPAFLQKLQNRINGVPDEDEDEGEDEEFEYVGGGRAPIPKRPAIPERPKDDPGSADEEEDFVDERPQVVVLKAGKHLTEREAENIRRKEKGLSPLPPLPEEGAGEKAPDSKETTSKTSTKSGSQGLSFSSSSKANPKPTKRKAVDDLKAAVAEQSKDKGSKNTSKKAKKSNKTLLSFGDDT